MILDTLSYNYCLKNKKFENISYSFKFEEEILKNEKFKEFLKEKMNYLENLITNNFFTGNASKEDEGNITPHGVEVGFRYKKSKTFRDKVIPSFNYDSASLKYGVSIYNDEIIDFGLDLRSYSEKQIILLKLYDSVLLTPDIILSKKAKIESNKINILRRENFNPNQSIDLLLTN